MGTVYSGLWLSLIFTSETLQERFKDFILISTLSRETDMDQLAKLGSGVMHWDCSFEAWMNKGLLNQAIGLGYGAHTELTRAFFAFDAASNKDLDPTMTYCICSTTWVPYH